MIEWTPEDSAAAIAQGWEIFSSNGNPDAIVQGKPYGDRPFELQALDDTSGLAPGASPLVDDDAAFEFARKQFMAGDQLMLKAASFLKENSPNEWDAIFGVLSSIVAQKILGEFLDAIDATGGLLVNRASGLVDGLVGDPEWLDLAEVAVQAEALLGRRVQRTEVD